MGTLLFAATHLLLLRRSALSTNVDFRCSIVKPYDLLSYHCHLIFRTASVVVSRYSAFRNICNHIPLSLHTLFNLLLCSSIVALKCVQNNNIYHYFRAYICWLWFSNSSYWYTRIDGVRTEQTGYEFTTEFTTSIIATYVVPVVVITSSGHLFKGKLLWWRRERTE